ncbi:MAG TPA: hypothetical protein VIF02_08425 [Methylocella sp.]
MDNQDAGLGRRGQSTGEAGQEYPDAQREALIPEIMGLMEQVNDSSIALSQRVELASRAMAKVTGIFLSEALAPVVDAERSVVLSRLSAHLKAIIDTLARKNEIEFSHTIDPHSPQFQICFEWFLEIVNEALVAAKVDAMAKNAIFACLTTALVGWEEKVQRRLKSPEGYASQPTPYIQKIKEESRRVKNETQDIAQNGQAERDAAK